MLVLLLRFASGGRGCVLRRLCFGYSIVIDGQVHIIIGIIEEWNKTDEFGLVLLFLLFLYYFSRKYRMGCFIGKPLGRELPTGKQIIILDR
jgi:hypothetical protein